MKNKLTARELSSFCGQMGMLRIPAYPQLKDFTSSVTKARPMQTGRSSHP